MSPWEKVYILMLGLAVIFLLALELLRTNKKR